MAVTMLTEPAWWLGPRFVTSACERNHSRSRPPCACHRWMDGQGVWPPPPRRGDVPSGGSPSPGPRWCSLVGCPRLGRRLAIPPKVQPPSGIALIASTLRSGSVGRSPRPQLPARATRPGRHSPTPQLPAPAAHPGRSCPHGPLTQAAAHPRGSCPQWPLTHRCSFLASRPEPPPRDTYAVAATSAAGGTSAPGVTVRGSSGGVGFRVRAVVQGWGR